VLVDSNATWPALRHSAPPRSFGLLNLFEISGYGPSRRVVGSIALEKLEATVAGIGPVLCREVENIDRGVRAIGTLHERRVAQNQIPRE
jgi:hypothetical protein